LLFVYILAKQTGMASKKNLRQRRVEDDSDQEESDDAQISEKLAQLKELQKLKKRETKGINVEDLLAAQAAKNPQTSKEPTRKYGLQDAKTLAAELDLGHTFSVETNRRDEDAEMAKFIEEELKKRKGLKIEEEQSNNKNKGGDKKPISLTDDVFEALPEHLIKAGKQKNEEMLSNQMLSGIPEVDLGLDERIRNIEATEEAKQKVLASHKKRDRSNPQFVPTNIAVNFVQNNRFNSETEGIYSVEKNKRQRIEPQPTHRIVEEPVVVIGDEPRHARIRQQISTGELKKPGRDKASDDFHFNKFKKQFKKY